MADAQQEMSNGSSQSRSVLAKPRLGGFGSSGFGTNTFGSILRPPQLKPGTNPFLKVTETEELENNEKTEKDTEKVTEERVTETNEDVPKFVPLGTTSSAPRSTTQVPTPAQPATGTSGFVFGQNLSERVVIQDGLNNGDAGPSESNVDAGPSEHSMNNGTSGLLFTSAAASVKDNNQEDSSGSSAGGSGAGLAAAAAEYERAQARPTPPAVITTTGEEDELNVMQISCRLFAWEAGSWRERGRGVLRLNDATADSDASRLVARVAGSLRVVLNTKIWPDMVAERAGAKSLRITASDAQQQVKLFLIMGNPSDIVQLHRAVAARIDISRRAAGGPGARLPDGGCSACAAHADREQLERLEPQLDVAAEADEADDAEDADEADEADEAEPEHTEEPKATKRKEPVDDATSPKRPCPDIAV